MSTINEKMTAIANAIRSKTGKEDKLTLEQMATEIEGIQTGGESCDHAMEDSLVARNSTEYVNNSVESIGYQAFRYYGSLKRCSFANVKTVSSYAFSECDALEQINIPNAITLGGRMIGGCSSIKTLHLPKVTTLADYALAQSGLVKVKFDAITRIAPKTFAACSNFETLILATPTLVTLANVSAFDNTLIANGTGYIYVPKALIEDYKVATNWITFANQFRAIEDSPEICGGITS